MIRQASPSGARQSALDPDERMAGAVLWSLLIDHAAWVHRRVESIVVIDDSTARRRVSIDFTLPEELGSLAGYLPGVPLTFLKKEVLRRFDFSDETGRALPMLTQEQNSVASANALIVIAESIIVRRAPAAVVREVRELAAASAADASARIEDWRRRAMVGQDRDWPTWRRLLDSGAFMDGATILRDNFVLLAAVRPEASERRVFKFSYDEAVGGEPGLPLGKRARTAVGWRAKALIFETPAVSLAASYHVELTAPEDLEIVVAGLDFVRRPGREPVTAAPDVADGPRVQRAHLNPPRVDPAYNASVFAALRAERAGFIPAAFLTSLLVAVLLVVGFIRLKSVSEPAQAQVVSPLLLIVPTIFAAFIIRPGEHKLASRVLVGARALLLLSVASAIVAAGALAAGWHDSHLRHIWLGAMIGGGAAAAGLLATNVWPRVPRS